MEKILISSCLLGERVRYHGGDDFYENSTLEKWKKEGRLVSICPEVSAGFPIPRPPSEIVGDDGGKGVLKGIAHVMKKNGVDYSDKFIEGARKALELARNHDIKIAILKEGSPSCGSNKIYSGDFSGVKVDGMGVTAALLKDNGIFVFSESQIDQALKKLEQLTRF